MTEYPWEPPLAGTEVEHLTGALDRLRTTFRWKADDLTVAGLQARFGASPLTLGGLLKHLAMVEDYTFTVKLRGEPLASTVGCPRARTAATTAEFTSAAKARWTGRPPTTPVGRPGTPRSAPELQSR